VECYECGNDSMVPRTVGHHVIYECRFCNALEGDATAIRQAYLEREALDRGMDLAVYPLVSVLENIAHLKVREASAGSPEDRIPPYVFFHLEEREGILRQIGHLLQSLEMSHRRTRRVWTLEAHYQRGELQFAFRPRFMKPVQDLDPDEIREAQDDLPLLAERFERDMALSWWS
jgi:hypothetical protein